MNSFESSQTEQRDAAMQETLEMVIGGLAERAAKDDLEIEPTISYDEASTTVSVEIIVRSSDMEIEYDGTIFKGSFRFDEWASASQKDLAL